METEIEQIPGGLQPPTEKKIRMIRSPSPGFRGRSQTPIRGRSMTPLQRFREKSATPTAFRSITPFICREDKEKTPFEIGSNIILNLASYKAIIDKALVMDISMEEEPPSKYIISEQSVIDRAAVMDISNVEYIYVEEDYDEDTDSQRDSESRESSVMDEKTHEGTPLSGDEEQPEKKKKTKKTKKVTKKKTEKKEKEDTPPKLKLDMGPEKPKVSKVKMFEQSQNAAKEEPRDKPPPKKKAGKLTGALAAMQAEEEKQKEAELQKQQIEEKMKKMKAEQEAKKQQAAEEKQSANEGEDEEASGEAEEGGGGSDDEHGSGSEHGSDDGGSGSGSGSGSGGSEGGSDVEEHDESGEEEGEDEKPESSSSDDDFTRPNEDEIGLWMIMADDAQGIIPSKYERKKFKKMTERERDIAFQKAREAARVPRIHSHLKDCAIEEGHNVKLTCTATGPELNIKWYLNGIPIEKSPKHRLLVNEGIISLEIVRALPDESGEYTCALKNNNGEASTSAIVTIFDVIKDDPIPPTFASARDYYHLNEDVLGIEVHCHGTPRPKISWIKDGFELKPSFKYTLLEEAHGVYKLEIYKPAAKDSGKYTCKAENKVDTAEIVHNVQFVKTKHFHLPGIHQAHSGVLKEKEEIARRAMEDARKAKEEYEARRAGTIPPRVRDEPPATVAQKDRLKFATQLRDRTALVGNKMKFSVSVIGPDPNIRWFKDETPLQYGPLIRNATAEGLSVVEMMRLSTEQTGQYRCVARNNFSEIVTSCYLKVYDALCEGDQEAPLFVLSIRDNYHAQENDLIIDCKVRANPRPVIVWLKDDMPIEFDERTQQIEHSDGVCELIINKPTFKDSGNYFCCATNNIGSQKVQHRVEFVPLPGSRRDSGMPPAEKKIEAEKKEGEEDATDAKSATAKGSKGSPRKPPSSKAPVETQSRHAASLLTVDELLKASRNKLHFVTHLKNCVFPEQSRVKLSCIVHGPDPNIRWLKDDNPVVYSPRVKNLSKDGLCILEINLCTLDDSGVYTCFARNTESDISCSCTLQVYETKSTADLLPTFTRALKDTYQLNANELYLETHVRAVPKAIIEWVKDGVKVEHDDKKYLQVDHPDGTCELVVNYPKTQDSGKYVCQATNSVGQSEITHYVLYEGKEAHIAENIHGVFHADHNRIDRAKSEARGLGDVSDVVSDGGNLDSEDTEKEEKGKRGKGRGGRGGGSGGTGKTDSSNAAATAIVTVPKKEPREPKKGIHFAAKLTDRVVAEGSKVKLTCYLEGADPAIKWFKDDNPVVFSPKCKQSANNGLCTLEFTQVTEGDSGNYKCFARNLSGEVNTTAKLEVYASTGSADVPPTFTRSLKETFHTNIQELNVSCHVRGLPTPTITWTKDGVTIEPSDKYQQIDHADGSCELNISYPAHQDSGKYVCQAENRIGKAEIAHFIQIEFKETRSSSLASTKELETINEATNTTAEDQKEENAEVATKGKKRGKQESSGGGGGRRSVAPPPDPKQNLHFIAFLTDRTVAEGGKTKLSCYIEGPDPNVRWMKDDNPLQQSPRCRAALKDGLVTLDISALVPDDSGEYKIIARNGAGEISCASHLNVYAIIKEDVSAPIFTNSIKDSYQIQSNQLIIECKLHDKSNSSIKWLKDNVPIEPDKKYSLIEHENGTKQLIISNPTRMDNGLYSCHAISDIDHMHIENISHYVDISDKLENKGVSPQKQKQSTKDKGAISKRKLSKSNIEENIETIEQSNSKVRLETHLKNVNIDEGEIIELFCNVKGSNLEVKWFYNNKPLSIDDDPTKYNSSTNENGTIQLEIFDCTFKDSGEYSCSIRNSRNEVFSTSTVNVYDKFSKEYVSPMAFTSSIKESYDSKQNELILDCYVRSRIPKCTWFKDNQNDIILSNKRYRVDDTVPGRKRLIIKNPVSCDFGRFLCRAEDEYQIDKIFIDIKDMNFMIRSQFVNDQQNYSECKAHITASETVNEKKDFDNNDTLINYEYVTKEYDVRHASARLHRDVKRKPQFTTELMDRKVTENSSIKLTCNILGIDTHVQWLKNCKPLVLTTRHRQQFHDGLATLEILGVLPDDNAEYTCVAKNEYGEQSSSSYLKVFPGYEKYPMPPIFTRSIKDTYNLSANEIVLECRVRGQPQPSIQWTKDGEYIGNGDKYQQFDQSDGCCKLIVMNAEVKDSGLYVCQAENSVSGDKISHNVEFVGKDAYILERTHGFFHRDPNKPHFRNTLGDHLVTAGGTIALQAEILHGPVDVQWLREKEPIVLNDKIRSIYDHGIHTLILPDATAELSGTYTCRAANAFGKVESVAHVHIVGPSVKGGKCPLFITRPETDMKIMTGDPFSISFRVTGDPKPKLVFMKGLRDITQNDRTLKEAHDDFIRFSVQRSQPTDSGTYCVLARNQHGTDRAFVTILVKQRARSITPTSNWSSQPIEDIIDVSYLKNPPGPISTEPILVNSGRNHISLQWGKSSKQIDAAPVLAYRIDAWEIGPNGGARWVELGKTPINTFDAFNLKFGCQYHIRVTPRNRYGWGPSTQTTYPIQIAGDHCLPEFTKILPGQLKALTNNDMQLECIAKGVPKPIILWYKNGIELKSRDERISIRTLSSICRLTIKNVTESDSGRYTCEATNNLGRVSTFARLQVVNDPKICEADTNLKRTMENDMGTHGDMLPHFTMRLRDRRIQATYPVRLTCQAIGWPTPDITWYKDGNVIENESGRYKSWNDGQFNTIEISKTNLQDCGRYTATAKNELGSVSCHCSLVVDKGIRAYIAPEFYGELDSLYIIKEFHDIRMSAQVEAYPTVGITWQRDGLPLRPSRRIITTLDHDGFVELTIANATKCDAGIYTCVASNAVGRVESNTRLIIEESDIDREYNKKIPEIRRPDLPYSKVPLFITKPRSSQAYEGDTVIIYCEVVGDPKPDVLWLRDFLNPDYYKDAPHFRRVGDGPEYRLEIPRAKLDFTGTYSVIAKNCHGETKAIISLQIYAKDFNKMDRGNSIRHGNVETHPMFTSHLKDLRCCDGDAIKLECHVEGIPEPTIFWEKDGRILPHIIDFVTSFDGGRATLAIEHVFPEDEGEYTCVASNNIGRAYSSACIIVDVPEEKENLVSRQLTRPPGILSPNSTPRSTPRTTPIRSLSPMPLSYRSTSIDISPKRHKCVPPKFYAVPHSRVAEEGETVRFQCAIAGHPMPWSTWDKNGVIVTPSARITSKERDDLRILEIEEVTYEDAGLYRITLENDYGRIEATARLDIIANKRRSAERSGVRTSASPRRNISCSRRLMGNSTRIGGRLALACNFRGTSAPVKKFYHNGEEIIENDRITVNCNDPIKSELFIENVQWDDQGEYSCIAENEYGMAATSTIIQLNNENYSDNNNVNNNNNDTDNTIICMDIPEFIRGIGNNILWTEGKPLDLECEMQCSMPYDIQWFKDDQIIMDSDEFSYIDHGNGMLALRISDPFVFDTGEYTCLITTDFGNCKTTCMVQIIEYTEVVDNLINNVNNNLFITTKLPVFQKYPETVVALYGSVVSICAQIHPPDAEVKWNICGRDVTDNARGILIENRNNGTKLMHILGLEHKHSGEIKCSVYYPNTNKIAIISYSDLVVLPASSQATTTTFDFNNEHSGEQPDIPAYIIRGPEDCTALIGGTIILETLFGGYPQPKVKWLQAGRIIAETENIKINISKGKTTLLLTNITADQSGKYSVEIMNEHSNDIVSASVAVEGPPEPPGGRPSVSQGLDRIAVAWCGPPYDGGCMITGFILEMQEITNDEWIEIASVVNSLAYTIKNLQPGLTYRFRVRAENIHGRSEPSQSSEDVLIVLGSAIITNNKSINTSQYINSNNYLNTNNNNNHHYNKNTVNDNFNGYDDEDNDDYNVEDDDKDDDANAKLETHIHIKPGGDFKTRFQLHEELGKGRFGIVYKCTENDTGQILAAKIVKCIKSKDKVKIQEEISIMQSLKHPKLLQLAAAFESPREVVMVMEYITGGELFERVVADDFTLTEHDCILFLRQICEGVDYMHSKSVVHLDLKPENIMCHTRTSHQIKIIDFGLAQRLTSDLPVRVLFGTPEFIPPEIISYEPIGFQSDMWSVGVICYVLLSGLSPFMGDSDVDTFSNITRADYDFDDEAFDAVSLDAKDFISNLLIHRKESRLTAMQCLKSNWLSQHHERNSNNIKLCTDKLKKFIIRRKWQKTGNAIRALGRMATLSANSRRNSIQSSMASPSPRPSISAGTNTSRMSPLNEEDTKSLSKDSVLSSTFISNVINSKSDQIGRIKEKICSERSDSGFSECSNCSGNTPCICNNSNGGNHPITGIMDKIDLTIVEEPTNKIISNNNDLDTKLPQQNILISDLDKQSSVENTNHNFFQPSENITEQAAKCSKTATVNIHTEEILNRMKSRSSSLDRKSVEKDLIMKSDFTNTIQMRKQSLETNALREKKIKHQQQLHQQPVEPIGKVSILKQRFSTENIKIQKSPSPPPPQPQSNTTQFENLQQIKSLSKPSSPLLPPRSRRSNKSPVFTRSMSNDTTAASGSTSNSSSLNESPRVSNSEKNSLDINNQNRMEVKNVFERLSVTTNNNNNNNRSNANNIHNYNSNDNKIKTLAYTNDSKTTIASESNSTASATFSSPFSRTPIRLSGRVKEVTERLSSPKNYIKSTIVLSTLNNNNNNQNRNDTTASIKNDNFNKVTAFWKS